MERVTFSRYLELRSVPKLAREMSDRAAANDHQVPATEPALRIDRSGSRPMSSGMLYQLLANPLYIGKVRHKGEIYDGEHLAIVDADLLNAV